MAAVAQPGVSRRLRNSRVVCALAIVVMMASTGLAVTGYMLVNQADGRHALEHRTALQTAIAMLRPADDRPLHFDSATLAKLQQIAAVRDLRFEAEPAPQGRELQSVVDAQGRIVGWLSWQKPRTLSQMSTLFWSLLALDGLCIAGFAMVALGLFRGNLRDLEASERRVWSLAHEDALTGLPNYRHIAEMIDDALADSETGGTATFALADLDGLDEVNQMHGHRGGDELLVAWAARLSKEVGEGAVCGRFDGDQFAILMQGADADSVQPELQRIAAALGRPFRMSGRMIQVGCTMGFAQAPRQAASRIELIRCAELALRAGKRDRRGGVVLFDPAMDAEVAERRFIERELKRALAHEGLDVHYQPILSSDGGRIVGVEALLRWNHRERGAIPPATFVPVAEQAGFMGPLGAFVLRRALSDALRWPSVFVSVNLSPVQVRDPALLDLVKACLDETKVPPQRLVLEVTEGVLIDNPDEAKARLDALRSLGLKLALDDFGTGYSSLTYLQRFRFDKLKIDKGFVAPLGTSPESQSIVQGIVRIGQALGLSTLAEGVETEEQRVLLRLSGCEEMQGFLFARPAPAEAIDRLLASESRVRAFRRTG